MNRKALAVIVVGLIIGSLMVGYAVAKFIGTITMPWEVREPLTMQDFSVPIGDIYAGETKTDSPSDYGKDLTVPDDTGVTFTLGGDHEGLTTLTVTIELRIGATLEQTVTLTKTAYTNSVLVASGTYDVYVGYDATAGSSVDSGEATVQLTY